MMCKLAARLFISISAVLAFVGRWDEHEYHRARREWGGPTWLR